MGGWQHRLALLAFSGQVVLTLTFISKCVLHTVVIPERSILVCPRLSTKLCLLLLLEIQTEHLAH